MRTLNVILLILSAGNLFGQHSKSPVETYNLDCNNCLTIRGLENSLKCANNIEQLNQEQKMGEVLVANKQEIAEKKEALYSDKFAGAKTISEYFAWNLAKATDDMLGKFNEQTPEERRQINELRDALRSHAEYEIEGDGHALIGPDNGKVIVQVIEKFGVEKARGMIAGAIDKGIQSPKGEVLPLKKHDVFEEFREIALKSVDKAIDDYLATEGKGKDQEANLNNKQQPVAAQDLKEVTPVTNEVALGK